MTTMVSFIRCQTIATFMIGFIGGYFYTTQFERSSPKDAISTIRQGSILDYEQISKVWNCLYNLIQDVYKMWGKIRQGDVYFYGYIFGHSLEIYFSRKKWILTQGSKAYL